MYVLEGKPIIFYSKIAQIQLRYAGYVPYRPASLLLDISSHLTSSFFSSFASMFSALLLLFWSQWLFLSYFLISSSWFLCGFIRLSETLFIFFFLNFEWLATWRPLLLTHVWFFVFSFLKIFILSYGLDMGLIMIGTWACIFKGCNIWVSAVFLKNLGL